LKEVQLGYPQPIAVILLLPTMATVLDPFRFVLIAVANRMNQSQLQVNHVPARRNHILREQLAVSSSGSTMSNTT
jgi:hypothetical protein